jgi:hypothetical protein
MLYTCRKRKPNALNRSNANSQEAQMNCFGKLVFVTLFFSSALPINAQYHNMDKVIRSGVWQARKIFRQGGLEQLKVGCLAAGGLPAYWQKKGDQKMVSIAWTQYMAMYTYGNEVFNLIGSSDPSVEQFFCNYTFDHTMQGLSDNDIIEREAVVYIVLTSGKYTKELNSKD